MSQGRTKKRAAVCVFGVTQTLGLEVEPERGEQRHLFDANTPEGLHIDVDGRERAKIRVAIVKVLAAKNTNPPATIVDAKMVGSPAAPVRS